MNTPLPYTFPWKADQAISGCPIIITNQGDHIANVYCQDDRDYILDCVNSCILMGAPPQITEALRFLRERDKLKLSLAMHETNMLALETAIIERDNLREVCRRVLKFWEGEPIPKQTPRIAETIGQLRAVLNGGGK